MLAAGYIDDVFGANHYQGATDGDVQDENGHGTFVAGVIGAASNNRIGVAGMNQVRYPCPQQESILRHVWVVGADGCRCS